MHDKVIAAKYATAFIKVIFHLLSSPAPLLFFLPFYFLFLTSLFYSIFLNCIHASVLLSTSTLSLSFPPFALLLCLFPPYSSSSTWSSYQKVRRTPVSQVFLTCMIGFVETVRYSDDLISNSCSYLKKKRYITW